MQYIGTDEEKRHEFYVSELHGTKGISLTRSIRFAANWENVIFELDQAKLIQDGYKIYPLDYWSGSYGDQNKTRQRAEAEEFLVGPLSNVEKYIRHIYLRKPKVETNMSLWQKLRQYPKVEVYQT